MVYIKHNIPVYLGILILFLVLNINLTSTNHINHKLLKKDVLVKQITEKQADKIIAVNNSNSKTHIKTKINPQETSRGFTDRYSYTEEDLYWLSRVIYAESGNEIKEGQIAVGNVILNRVRNKQFPNTIKQVIFQKNQFSCVDNGSIYNNPTEDAIDSAKKVLNGIKVIDDNVYYFYNPQYSDDSWIQTRKFYRRIGNHVFLTN